MWRAWGKSRLYCGRHVGDGTIITDSNDDSESESDKDKMDEDNRQIGFYNICDRI